MKLKYERPSIIKMNAGLMNKYGTRTEYEPVKQIDGVPVKRLIETHGSPVFVISERTIRSTYKNSVRAFKTRYPKVQLSKSAAVRNCLTKFDFLKISVGNTPPSVENFSPAPKKNLISARGPSAGGLRANDPFENGVYKP